MHFRVQKFRNFRVVIGSFLDHNHGGTLYVPVPSVQEGHAHFLHMAKKWYSCISASEGRRDLILGSKEPQWPCLFMCSEGT